MQLGMDEVLQITEGESSRSRSSAIQTIFRKVMTMGHAEKTLNHLVCSELRGDRMNSRISQLAVPSESLATCASNRDNI
ncbi:hypothetical protein AcW1_009337 [Taiwanofungus camphoratus]|nr:hypothetical protein AcV5_003412 [Antrodia cinnamomea]KAI0947630.1 hypothetical protein AcW1_009337 [Antrodia cinnamomea]